MRPLRIMLVLGLMALMLGLAGCGHSQARNNELNGGEAEQVAWRPTGTGFYHLWMDN